jgi:site-specific recombinase XerD
MNEIITDIKALQEETLLNLKSSKANNTVRAYKSDFNDFALFCTQNGFKSLPSGPKIVSLYLTHLSTKEFKISTLKRRLVSIGVIHKLKGHYLDTKHPTIIENIMGIKRRKGSIQKSKKPLIISDLKIVIDVIDQQKKEEIVSLNYDDLDFVTEGVKINIRRSKTDQFGEGTVKALPYFDNSQYCPVVSLKKWIDISNNNFGSLFRRFSKGLRLTENRLTDQTVALLIKEYLTLAGINSKNYSGHSLRSGFATSAAESGAEERSIMAMTGHKTTQMVRRYIKEANLFKNNALNKLDI